MTRLHSTRHARRRAQLPPAPAPQSPLTAFQQRTLSEVIDAARRTPGALRLLNRADFIFTAMCRDGRTSWRIEDTYRQPIADGEC